MAVDVVELFDEGVAGEAGAEDGGDVGLGPGDDLLEGVPERFLFEGGVGDVGAGDDEGVDTDFLEVVEGGVMLVDVGLGVWGAAEAGEGEGVDIELGDLVTVADKAHKLLFGDTEGGIGHHIEEADMEFADILVESVVEGEDFLAVLAQVIESG